MDTPTFDRIRDIAADVLQMDGGRITAASSPETIESWDSVANLNLLLALEESFGFQFDPEEMDRMKNIGQIAAITAAKIRA